MPSPLCPSSENASKPFVTQCLSVCCRALASAACAALVGLRSNRCLVTDHGLGDLPARLFDGVDGRCGRASDFDCEASFQLTLCQQPDTIERATDHPRREQRGGVDRLACIQSTGVDGLLEAPNIDRLIVLTKNIVEAMPGGKIYVTSRLNEGSVFTVKLDLEIVPEEALCSDDFGSSVFDEFGHAKATT